MDAHRARRLGPAFLVLAVSGAALLSFVVPLGGRTQDLRSPSASGASGARTHGVTARQAFSWDADEPPPIPASPEEMLQQASDAVMRAYRDGKTRQAVRLRLDQLFDMESLYVKGIEALQLATAGTLIYRESENELQDMAVFYLPGRDLMAEGKTQNFIRKMNDRLVLLVNSEPLDLITCEANQVLKKKSVLGVRRDVVAVLSLRARVGLEGMMEGVLEMEMVMKRVQLARHREVVKQ
eukprot:s1667_g10.t1